MCLSAVRDEQPSAGFLFVSVFLACAVEAVEALTIVLAVGLTRGEEHPSGRQRLARSELRCDSGVADFNGQHVDADDGPRQVRSPGGGIRRPLSRPARPAPAC